ncbi:hypothetical protein CBR_g45908 [Chara braunii]|uniref:Uncharacterized protein n=1 Tax=Chara braunii TaxID=69332 RepID=A0A388LZS5_CHABU|nr:hypothetical protein CBR_g45908 [Chara braunii]|eukprot:GBG87753.1 hypothetical protein CBR_g45908 [Chara braunii]
MAFMAMYQSSSYRQDVLWPGWVPYILHACSKSFFGQCEKHEGVVEHSGEPKLKFFCVDCSSRRGSFADRLRGGYCEGEGEGEFILCNICRKEHASGHRILQIRKSSLRFVVRLAELQGLLDLTAVLPYTINSAKVIFLERRPQERLGKGQNDQCEGCGRGIAPLPFRFCSIECKMIRNWDLRPQGCGADGRSKTSPATQLLRPAGRTTTNESGYDNSLTSGSTAMEDIISSPMDTDSSTSSWHSSDSDEPGYATWPDSSMPTDTSFSKMNLGMGMGLIRPLTTTPTALRLNSVTVGRVTTGRSTTGRALCHTQAKLPLNSVTVGRVTTDRVTTGIVLCHTQAKLPLNSVTVGRVTTDRVTTGTVLCHTQAKLRLNSVTVGRVTTGRVTTGIVLCRTQAALRLNSVTVGRVTTGRVTTGIVLCRTQEKSPLNRVTVGRVTTGRVSGGRVTGGRVTGGHRSMVMAALGRIRKQKTTQLLLTSAGGSSAARVSVRVRGSSSVSCCLCL